MGGPLLRRLLPLHYNKREQGQFFRHRADQFPNEFPEVWINAIAPGLNAIALYPVASAFVQNPPSCIIEHDGTTNKNHRGQNGTEKRWPTTYQR